MAIIPRLRTEEVVETGHLLTLDEAYAHHLLNVLRLRSGAEVAVVDGHGLLYAGQIVRTSPCEICVGKSIHLDGVNPPRALHIWLPILKGGRSDGVVRQLVELGATQVVPLVTERSVVRPSGEKKVRLQERWQRIADEATRQCGRTDRVHITAVGGLPKEGRGLFLWEEMGTSFSLAADKASSEGIRLLVGPEGGLSFSEAQALSDLGWTAIHLGTRTLRAETAVIVAATLAVYG
jgi:16S rRNA (uracil1498-N3)-methyltransferase